MGSSLLDIEGLSAGYGDDWRAPPAPAVDGIDLTVDAGDFFTLLGPSGCGKTTLLRCVAGLHRPRAGRISIAERTVYDGGARVDVPPNRRRVGMVFQSHAIWPHLDVFGNAAFPLTSERRSRRRSPKDIRRRVAEVLDLVELGHLSDRPAARLSGGQQQRLALARALVGEPELLLLDEPLSNLDAPLRVSMRMELKRLQRELGVTVLFVTHDQDEALSVSSAVGVMHEGRLVQTGTPTQVYERPANRFVAAFVGRANVIAVRTEGNDMVSDVLGHIVVEPGAIDAGLREVVAIVRPERVEVSPSDQGDGPNRWPALIREVAFRGDSVDVVLQIQALTIEARVAHDREGPLEPGARVSVHLPPNSVRVVPADGSAQGLVGEHLPGP